jgi:hypothetical protein
MPKQRIRAEEPEDTLRYLYSRRAFVAGRTLHRIATAYSVIVMFAVVLGIAALAAAAAIEKGHRTADIIAIISIAIGAVPALLPSVAAEAYAADVMARHVDDDDA